MGENIFALQLSQPQPQEVLPVSGIPWDSGLRAMLSVTTIWAKTQTTVLFGNSLYMIWYDIGQLTRQDGFRLFLRPWFGASIPAAQLDRPPYAATPALYNRYPGLPIPPPVPPIATGRVTMLDAGFDPLRGYWIAFAGNYYLGFPLFKNWPNVIKDGPKALGFQPSGNNPGGGTPGSGTPPKIPPQTC